MQRIEKSATRKGDYVGYANGVWHIRRGAVSGWRAFKLLPMSRNVDTSAPVLYARTLRQLDVELAKQEKPAVLRAITADAIFSNPSGWMKG